jgi:hypothetical protein
MINKYMETCSNSLAIKDMQYKSKQHLHFISPQLKWPHSRAKTTNAGKDVTKQKPLYLLVGMQITTTIVESSYEDSSES